jgi:hypothetical protein
LCGGRFARERLLRDDLVRGWRDWHRRAGGGDGGWWIPLEERATQLLLVSAADTPLIAALEPTLWKPLSIDSPVLPYARAGDPHLSPRIVQVLHERQLVDRGAWSYHPLPATGPDLLFDLWGGISGRGDPQWALQQARVFRAMQLPIAALRVLRGSDDGRRGRQWHDLFAQCQLDLAYAERLAAGRSSNFRTLVWLLSTDSDETKSTLRAALQNPDVRQNASPALQACAAAYMTDELAQALDAARGDEIELHYARALLSLEAGQPQQASQILKTLLERFPHERLSAAARDVLESLST